VLNKNLQKEMNLRSFSNENKKMLVFGFVMILMAMVASTAFVYCLNGVTWSVDDNGSSVRTMYLYNNNDYIVRVETSSGQIGYIGAHEELYIKCFKDTTLCNVSKY
jgi:hypothetical protein